MSTLKAEIVRIEVVPHPNADRLDLCKVKGWQCVAQKGTYTTDDLAIYIPIDSVLPPELVTKLGIEKMYHKRIRTVKLRGYISQGMLAPMSILPADDKLANESARTPKGAEGLDVTELLGITKYEEPISVEMAGQQLPEEPGMLKYTDIENLKNYPDVFLSDDTVIVREKIHGSNFRAAKLHGQLFVGSHNRNLVRNDTNLYWRAAIHLKLDDRLGEGEQVFAEVYGKGVQDLDYGVKPGDIKVVVFDMFRGGQFLSDCELSIACFSRGWTIAPLIHAGAFSDFAMPKQSLLGPKGHIAEGVVIRSEQESWSERLQGRKILKSISDEYLLRKDGTERH